MEIGKTIDWHILIEKWIIENKRKAFEIKIPPELNIVVDSSELQSSWIESRGVDEEEERHWKSSQ